MYKLGIGSKHNDDELRYSLRSLSNFQQLGKVYIVGHKPNWIQNITHIQAYDPFLTNKDGNLINKIILACKDPNISNQFLHFSDDQLLLSSIDLEFFKRPLIASKYQRDVSVPGKKLNRWQKRLWRTIHVLKGKQLPYNCYEAHIPYLIDKNNYSEVLMQYDYGADIGYCGNTLYFNTLKANGKEMRPNDMIRIEKQITSVSEIQTLSDDKLLMNYTDAAINPQLFEYLKQKFPNKSQYEI